MSSIGDRLLDCIQQRRARAGVVGLGYVGLPLAVEFARSGLTCTGIDLDVRKIDAIARGHSYIPDVPSADVQELTAAGRLSATTDFSVDVNSPQAEEMVKLLENTFRMVNIGLVNEIALMCDRLGLDVWEVVDAAKTKPFGFMPFYPGPGLGGHCIPIDPFYLSWKAKQTGFEPRFIELAGAVNSAMPHAVVDTIADALNLHRRSLNGSHVLIAGLAYKRDIDDIRESPSLDVMSILHQKGARLSYVDPYVPKLAGREWAGGYDLTAVTADRAAFAAADCVAILTDHRAFDYHAMIDAAPLIVDTRNAVKQRYPHVFRIGASNPPCEPLV